MRSFLARSILVVAAISCFAPRSATADDARPTPVPLISPQRLVEKIQSGEKIVFLDVRQPEEYAPEHIPGALNVPKGEIAARKVELPRDVTLIPYCNMDFRGFAAARELEALGFRVALMQERGLQGWKSAGLPTAGQANGVSDAAALEKVMKTSPQALLGERFAAHVAPSGKSRAIPVKVEEWYFQPNELEVEAGDEVHLSLTSAKGDHYFVLPDYEVEVLVPQGQTRDVVFTADRAGDYRFGTCEWDGAALQVMKGQLRVRPAAATTRSE